jgi:hypothetical protein
MNTVKVEIARSKQWVLDRRLDTGENTPEEITVEVPVAELSIGARKILMDSNLGSYPSTFRGHFNENHQFSIGVFYGRQVPMIDSEAPTVEQIDMAMIEAKDALDLKKAVRDAERAERQAKIDAEDAAKAELAQKMADARLLLAGELKRLAYVADKRQTLAEFLAEIPQDALRGTLKKIASGSAAVAALEKTIEDASPVTIFEDDSDD